MNRRERLEAIKGNPAWWRDSTVRFLLEHLAAREQVIEAARQHPADTFMEGSEG